MSLVQTVITKDFILMGADTREIPDGSNEALDHYNRILKINDGILVGITGDVNDNLKLFDGFCQLDPTEGFKNSDEAVTMSYSDFVQALKERFETIKQEHEAEDNPKKYNISSVVCGYNGEELEATCFVIDALDRLVPNALTKTCLNDKPYHGISCGRMEHYINLDKYAFQQKPTTILQYKNVLRSVFETGAQLDKTMNSNCCFEKIRKTDLLK